jgi:hypothetical protein
MNFWRVSERWSRSLARPGSAWICCLCLVLVPRTDQLHKEKGIMKSDAGETKLTKKIVPQSNGRRPPLQVEKATR